MKVDGAGGTGLFGALPYSVRHFGENAVLHGLRRIKAGGDRLAGVIRFGTYDRRGCARQACPVIAEDKDKSLAHLDDSNVDLHMNSTSDGVWTRSR